MDLRILRYLALYLSIVLSCTLYGSSEKDCPTFLFGTSTQLANHKSFSNETEKMKLCLNLMTPERSREVAKEIHQDPKLLDQFDEYYVDIQVECNSFLNADQTPDYCPDILGWAEELGEAINEKLDVTRPTNPLAELTKFSDQLEEHFDQAPSRPVLGEARSNVEDQEINDSPRLQKTIQEISGREEMIEACEFLAEGSWVDFSVSDLEEWVNIIENLYHSEQNGELDPQAFCFLKTYYEAIEDYDSLIVLLLEMPDGEHFCKTP